MIRQIVVAIVLGLGLSACGVGADEDLTTLGLELADRGAIATSQDPVPPAQQPATLAFVADKAGNIAVVSMSSEAPAAPGEENGSSQDPIPPKVQGPWQLRRHR